MAYYNFDGGLTAETPAAAASVYGTSAGGDTLSGSSTPTALWAEGPNDSLIGASGSDTFYLQSSGAHIQEAPGGAAEIVAWQNESLADYANVSNLSVGGDSTYAAGNAAENLIIATGANQQLYGGGGEDVLVGNGQNDTFIVVAGQGNDAIYGFNPASDEIRLEAGYTNFAQVQSHLTQVGSDVQLDLGGGQGVVIRNTQIAQLTAANFQLAFDTSTLGGQTFDDEFNGTSLSQRHTWGGTGTWDTDYGYQGQGGVGSYTLTGNGESEIYVNPDFTGTTSSSLGLNPFSEANGVLAISAWKVDAATAADMWGYQYASGMISTKDSFSQTYGYFEMRAELPTDAGAWPAFWLVPADGSWPPELDVMETLSKDVHFDYTTAHSDATGTHTSVSTASYIPDTADGFHTYGVLWTPTDLEWFVDGVEVFHAATPADMNKPMYMIANVAMGGWGGTIDDSTLSQAQMKIDYIRAYSLAAYSGGSASPPPPVSPPPPPVSPPPVSPPPGGSGPTDTVFTASTAGGETLTGGGGDTFVFKSVPWVYDHIDGFVLGSDKLDFTAIFQAAGYAGADPIGDHHVILIDDGAGGTVLQFVADGQPGSPDWGTPVVDLAGVPASAITSAVFTSPPTPPPAPAGLSDAAIAGGYVNAAHDTAAQTLTGTAQPGATVTVFDGTTALGSVTADAATGAWTFTLGVLADGAHSLTAAASQAGGNPGPASAPLSFTVDTQPPPAPAALADPALAHGYVGAAGETASQALSGTAEAGATVAVYDQGVEIGTAVADPAGAWSYGLGVLQDGQHQLTATATDAAGNTGPASAALSFTVDTHAPVPAVADVLYNSATRQTVISGTTEAGASVKLMDNGAVAGSATADASGAWSTTLKVPTNGALHVYTVSSTDTAGNTGASAGETLYDYSGREKLAGGAGDDVLIGKGGDTLTGGAGHDAFVFNTGFGQETVTDFTPGTDVLHIDHRLFSSLADVLQHAAQSGASTVITYDGADVITLQNTKLSSLTAGDFLFF